MNSTAISTKKIPVAEIFGPTIQGEGRWAGRPAYFVRLGGCDFTCSWCDTPYAVEAEQVRKLDRMTQLEIYQAILQLPKGPQLVVLTGGNPALFDLTELIRLLQVDGMWVSCETQGSKYQEWFTALDLLCLSPKGPSAQLTQAMYAAQREGLEKILTRSSVALIDIKVPIFSKGDLSWLKSLILDYGFLHSRQYFATVGNDVGVDDLASLSAKYQALIELVIKEPEFYKVHVMPQLHILAYGNERGR